MRAQDIFGLFGRPRVGLFGQPKARLGLPSEELITERAAKICSAAETHINGGSAKAAADEIYHAISDPGPGSTTPMGYRDMMAFLSEAVFNQCPDLKNIIMTLAAPDINIARQKEEEGNRANLYNPSAAYIGPGNVATGGGSGKPPTGESPESGGAPPEFTNPNPPAPGYQPVPTTGAPSSTGGANSYEEQAAEYSQKLREASEAAQKSQEEADAQIKASNAARDKAMEEMKAKYESGNPNAVCGPGEFWDGRQCRGSVQGRGGLTSQAMNLGPSGGAQMVTPGNLDVNPANLTLPGMGRRSFPVVNL